MGFRILTVSALFLAALAQGEPEFVFHQVDTQKTFWQGMHGEADGPIATPGTREIAANVALLAQLAYISRNIKSISSRDIRFPSEGRIYSQAGVSGPRGPERIPEAEVYAQEKQVAVPHHEERDGKLVLVPYDVEKIREQILDPAYEIVIEKNGFPAYDVFRNPRTEKIYSLLKPKRVYVYGTATDWCVDGVLNSLLDRGYEVYIVKDAIAGVDAEDSRKKLDAMEKRGAKLVTTHQVLEMFPHDARALPRSPAGVPGCELAHLLPLTH